LQDRRRIVVRIFPSDDGVSVTFRDVTEPRRTANELRTSEARYRAMFEHAMDGMLLATPDGGILAANAAACRMLGRPEAEIRTVGRAGITDPDDPRVAAIVKERARAGHAESEITCVRKDGSKFPAELSTAEFNDADGRKLAIVTFRDVTEKKRAESRLQRIASASAVLGSTLESAATIQNLAHLLVPRLADSCTIDLLENGALRRVAAAHRDPAKQRALEAFGSLGPLIHREAGAFKVARTREPELVPVVDDAWLRAAVRDEAHLAAARAYRARSAMSVPIVTNDKVLGVISLAIVDDSRRFDASDLATAQAIADRAASAIDNALLYEQTVHGRALRDEMLGVVSHDLRSPLCAIRLEAHALADKTSGHTQAQLVAIERAAAYADSLIKDLLSVAALESGHMPLARRAEPTPQLLREAIELQRLQAAEHSIALELFVDDATPDCDVDRYRMLQALGNLIDNAVKLTPPGGRVRVGARADGASVALSVSDTGPGIPPAALSHVFDRFWQVAETRRGDAGLGLAIAKGIVEAHGGSIDVDSVVGRGATFTIRVPAAGANDPMPS
jgi:PAS domain S-box-containing protein